MQNKVILYIGNDQPLVDYLSKEMGRLGYGLKSLPDCEAAFEELQSKTFLQALSGMPDSHAHPSHTSHWFRFRSRYWLVLFDRDLTEETAVDELRTIKACDGSVSVVVLSERATLLNVALAQQNGADACLLKPMRGMSMLLEAVAAAFRKTELWWKSVEDVVRADELQPLPSHTPPERPRDVEQLDALVANTAGTGLP